MKKTICILALTVALTACHNGDKKNVTETTATKQDTGTENTSQTLLDRKWKLLELNGKPIVLDTVFKKEAYIIFDKDMKVNGNAGCNGFGGTYQLEGKDGIRLSEMVATQMACPNLDVEGKFLEALKAVKSYNIDGMSLMLTNGTNEIVAEFEETAP